MTFEEAKKRKNYKFSATDIEQLIPDIRKNYMRDMYENGDPERGIAVLELGYVDIEVNLFTAEQCRSDAEKDDKSPVIDYFVCIKRGETESDWESDDYLDRDVKVDWQADTIISNRQMEELK